MNLTRILKSGGIFAFDYILGDGDGQDTLEAISQRPDVINFIRDNFELIDGEYLYDQSMGITICKKI